jgi:endonuclease/exonuclease/phosphatase family metal-dependent hydrolase
MELHALSYNVMAPVAEPFRCTGQVQRMKQVAKTIVEQIDPVAFVDFVLVQESIVTSQHAVLRQGMRNAGFVHETKQLVGSLRNLKLVQGGLVLFSRHPIMHEEQMVFDGMCAQEDCMASKGCVYVSIKKNGQQFHVFGVHLQAWETPKSRAVRRGQMKRVKKFIDAQKIQSEDPVILLGDFNVDMYSQRRQMQALQDQTNCSILKRHPDTHPFSSDPLTNQLMGVDDDMAYSSDAYPGGCYKDYLRTLHCNCCPQEWLDYALVSKDHASIDQGASWMRIIPVKVAPFVVNLTLTIQREITDISDHYPLLANYVFPDICPGNAHPLDTTFYNLNSFDSVIKDQPRDISADKVYEGMIAVTVCLVLFLVLHMGCSYLSRRKFW